MCTVNLSAIYRYNVLGYFVAYTSEKGRPPLVFVLSEKGYSILLFPFVNRHGQDLVEYVLLPEIPISALPDKVKEGSLLNRNLLVVLLLLCGGHGDGVVIPSLEYQYPLEGTRKSFLKEKIQTVQESMSELLQAKDREIEEMKKCAH